MSSPGLLVIGSGPGNGVSAASLFAQKKFDKIALISRDPSRLAQDKATVLEAAKQANREFDVQTWAVDITDTTAFKAILRETEKFATFTCVLFNAARVAPSELLEFPEEEIIRDFMVCHLIPT